MSESDLQKLSAHIDDLVSKAHVTNSKEALGLFKEIRGDIKGIKKDINQLEDAVEKLEKVYTADILPNLKSWNDVTDNYKDDKKWLTRLIGGVLLTAVMGLILAKNIGV
mgnify:CR=1 FL=1